MTDQGLIESFVAAFNSRDPAAMLALLNSDAPFEMPLLGQRLVGHPEIQAGLERIHAATVSCRIEFRTLAQDASVSIGEGTLRARLPGVSAALELPMALVATSRGAVIARLSVYLNTRGQRLWSDSPLLPRPRAVAGA